MVVQDGLVLRDSRGGVIQLVELLKKGTSDEEVHMMAMAVIANPSFPPRCLLGVVMRMAVISFKIPWQLS